MFFSTNLIYAFTGFTGKLSPNKMRRFQVRYQPSNFSALWRATPYLLTCRRAYFKEAQCREQLCIANRSSTACSTLDAIPLRYLLAGQSALFFCMQDYTIIAGRGFRSKHLDNRKIKSCPMVMPAARPRNWTLYFAGFKNFFCNTKFTFYIWSALK